MSSFKTEVGSATLEGTKQGLDQRRREIQKEGGINKEPSRKTSQVNKQKKALKSTSVKSEIHS